MNYLGVRALVTGGLGFIGSNLVLSLVREGALVTVVDPEVLGCGGNRFNLSPVEGHYELVSASAGDVDAIRPAIQSADVIFNLAGEISHVHSMLYPERDLEINTLSQLRFVEACARFRPGVRVIYAGTRQVYGTPDYLPVDEKHPIHPVDFNGVHKYAATQYHLMMSRSGQIDACVLRLTNVYGPRMALDVPCQGFLATYLRRVLTGRGLTVFGDGRQLRDPMFVDDAVDAFLRAGRTSELAARSYNVGGPEPLPLAAIASSMSEAAGVEPPEFAEFPPERKLIDIGSYYTDSTRIRADLGWSGETRFFDGIRTTLAYYSGVMDRYLDPSVPDPPCKLRHIRADAVLDQPAAVPAGGQSA